MFRRLVTTMALFSISSQLSAQSLPNAIPNLQLWLDASDVYGNGSANPADGSVVTTWSDKSGLGHNASVAGGQSGAQVYASQINGKSVLRFNRIDQHNGSGFIVPGVDIRAAAMPATTIFTVYRQGAHSGDHGIWGNDDGGWDRFFFSSWTSAGSSSNGGVSFGPQPAPNPSALSVIGSGTIGTTQLLTTVYDKNGGLNASAVYFNGIKQVSFTDQTDNTNAMTAFRIGFDGDDNFYNGDIAEMIIYNRKLTDCEITQVNRYLSQKYGVTFSTVDITASGATTFYTGGSVTLSSSVTGTAYKWLKDGNVISGATSQQYVANASGDYRVVVTNGCDDTSAVQAVTVQTMPAPGHALNLDGVNDYVNLGNSTALQAPNIKTMEAWVRFNDLATNQEIMSHSIVGQGIEVLIYNNTIAFYCMNGTDASFIQYASGNLQTGKWYHIAASWDGATKESMKLYINGRPAGTRTDMGNINLSGIANPIGSFRIGDWSDAGTRRPLNGSVDEVRIWSAQRDSVQINADMFHTIAPTTGLVAYYRFDHGIASGNNAGLTSAYDFSGNNRTGTLVNMSLNGAASNWLESYAMVVPGLQPADSIYSTGFIARWNAPESGNAENYYLDVSTVPDFSSMVTGYNNVSVGSATSYLVSGLVLGQQYYYRVRANKASVANQAGDFFSQSVQTVIGLPVTWLGFTAQAEAGKALLHWQTARESGSDFFAVERSADGRSFTEIGRVQAAANSTLKQAYRFTDEAPLAGQNIYRIRQQDVSGQSSYTSVRLLSFHATDAGLRLYPSVTSQRLYVESAHAGIAVISDMNGRPLMQLQLQPGRQQFDVSHLAAGTYLMHLPGNTAQRFIRQ